MPQQDIDKLLRTAINERRLLKIVYHGKLRTVEPHDYGIQNQTVKLLVYQLVGESTGGRPNWRLMEVDQIESVRLSDRTFSGGRGPSGKPHKWEQIFARVEPGDGSKITETGRSLQSYTVLFEPAEEGGYVVTCPALSGLVTEGDNYQQARARAIEAIELYLESLQQDGQPFPPDKKLALDPLKEEIEIALPQSA